MSETATIGRRDRRLGSGGWAGRGSRGASSSLLVVGNDADSLVIGRDKREAEHARTISRWLRG